MPSENSPEKCIDRPQDVTSSVDMDPYNVKFESSKYYQPVNIESSKYDTSYEPVYIERKGKLLNDTFNLKVITATNFTACKNECNNLNECVAFAHVGVDCDSGSSCPKTCFLSKASGFDRNRGQFSDLQFDFDHMCIEYCDEIYENSELYNTYIKASVGDECVASIDESEYIGSFQTNCNDTIKEYPGIKCCGYWPI
jgi:hypothetical protein